jgi:DNA repair exonuclease SbcCD ATPase subunit
MIDLEQEAEEVGKILAKIDHLERTVTTEAGEVSKVTERLKRTQDAQEVLQLLAQAVQQQAHQRISAVVSSCLSAVFGEGAYTFKIEFERKRGKTEASLRFVRGDLDIDPLTASGGGAIDVAAFSLRVACLVLHRPRLSRVVVLDEPFRYVSAEYQDNVRGMLEGLAKDMGIQVIMVTHQEVYETGEIINL